MTDPDNTNHTFNGYGCEVQWDGTTLKARGTNKATHLALLGQNPIDVNEFVSKDATRTEQAMGGIAALKAIADTPEYLILTRDQFTVEKYMDKPNLFINGNLTIRETNGRKHQFHFMKKHKAVFDWLVQELNT